MARGPCQLLIKEEGLQGAVWTLEDKRLVLQQPGNKKAQLCKELQAHSWHPFNWGGQLRREHLWGLGKAESNRLVYPAAVPETAQP